MSKLVADRADDGTASVGGGILCARRRASLGTGFDGSFGICRMQPVELPVVIDMY